MSNLTNTSEVLATIAGERDASDEQAAQRIAQGERGSQAEKRGAQVDD